MLKTVRLQNFRCHNFFDLRDSNVIRISQYQDNWMHLSGSNGAGKTSILEAISLLVPGKGIRKANKGDFVTITQEEWRASFDFEGRTITLLPHNGGRKIIDNTGEKQWYQEIMVFWMTPQSTVEFFHNKCDRRGALDKWISSASPVYYKTLQRYQKAYKQWSKCCREPLVAQSFEKLLMNDGQVIMQFRQDWIKQLDGYYPKIEIHETGLETNWEQARYAYTANGPHKADVRLIGHIDHQCASTGEQKLWLFLLICKLIEIHQAANKILLLDDWSENFDDKNQQIIQNRVKEIPNLQIISSGVK